MKKHLLFFFLIACSVKLSAQETQASLIPSNINYKTICYVDGVRLDSVDARYATFSQRANGLIQFDYGQIHDSKKSKTLNDSTAHAIYFDIHNDMFVLNLLDYNGWELFSVSNLPNAIPNYILKKKAIK